MSMHPTLADGRLVLAITGLRNLKIGDVIIFRHEGLEKIKRVQFCDSAKLFVVGDNQQASTDSRRFGWVERSNVIGRVFWPVGLRGKSR